MRPRQVAIDALMDADKIGWFQKYCMETGPSEKRAEWRKAYKAERDHWRPYYGDRLDTVLGALATVDHAFLDAAREGLPMESGLAAKFWLQAIKVLKEGA